MNEKKEKLFVKASHDLANDCKDLGSKLSQRKLNRSEFLQELAKIGNKFLDTFEEIEKNE